MMADLPSLSNAARSRSAAIRLAALLCLCAMQSAFAHQLRVFAAADGDLIRGSAYFAGGGAAPAARVRVESADGTLLGTPVPDAEGRFSWRAATPTDHLVIVQSADGHRAEWLVTGAELSPAFAGRAEMPTSAPADQPASVPRADAAEYHQPQPQLQRSRGEAAAPLDPVVAAAIERAVARQVRPLRKELAEARARARVQDVIGGIGYIVGVAGLGLWWAARSRAREGMKTKGQTGGAAR